jgi:type VI protein secretion system component VasF
MTTSAPRRSPRLAEKASASAPAVTIAPVAVVPTPRGSPPPKKIGRSKKALLEAALELRRACANARTAEDWAACRAFAHKLNDAADAANVGESLFITDCAYWCSYSGEQECGSYAVTAIEAYIESVSA